MFSPLFHYRLKQARRAQSKVNPPKHPASSWKGTVKPHQACQFSQKHQPRRSSNLTTGYFLPQKPQLNTFRFLLSIHRRNGYSTHNLLGIYCHPVSLHAAPCMEYSTQLCIEYEPLLQQLQQWSTTSTGKYGTTGATGSHFFETTSLPALLPQPQLCSQQCHLVILLFRSQTCFFVFLWNLSKDLSLSPYLPHCEANYMRVRDQIQEVDLCVDCVLIIVGLQKSTM